MNPNDEKELSRLYGYIPRCDEQINVTADMTALFHKIVKEVLEKVPASADRSSAIRYLRLAQMQMNSAICHDWPTDEKKDGEP